MTANPQGETTATAYVTIRIVDENDETPTFSQAFYNASVQENMPLRIPITFLPLGTEMIVHDYDQVNKQLSDSLTKKVVFRFPLWHETRNLNF